MKNQYFGDIYDYLKYGLLRQLSCYGQVSTAICWMLTEDDGRRDGHRIDYLYQPEKWSKFDPALFKHLRRQILERKLRNVRAIEERHLLPNSRFYSDGLTDDPTERHRYFEKFLEFARVAALVFFDPDTGVEVKSVKYGRKGSSRYLFWDEVEQAFSAGHSLLVYQHMPPKPRQPLLGSLVCGLARSTHAGLVYVYRTKRVSFLLVPQTAQIEHFNRAASRVRATWGGILEIDQHLLS